MQQQWRYVVWQHCGYVWNFVMGIFVPEMEQLLLNLQLKYHILFLDGLMIMILLPQLFPPQVAA